MVRRKPGKLVGNYALESSNLSLGAKLKYNMFLSTMMLIVASRCKSYVHMIQMNVIMAQHHEHIIIEHE